MVNYGAEGLQNELIALIAELKLHSAGGLMTFKNKLISLC